MKRNPNHRKKAFTLIELLVVIAIIAILAAILFPVFAQAKLAAKGAATLSNLKQNILGAVMYANDYDDTCFMSWQGGPCCGNPNGGYAVQQLYPYTKNVQIVWDVAGGIPSITGGRPMPPGYWGDWTLQQTLSWNNNGLYTSVGQRTYTTVAEPSNLMQLLSVYSPYSNTNGGGFAFDGTQGSCFNTIVGGYDDINATPLTGSVGIGVSANTWHHGGYAAGFMDGHVASPHGKQYQATDCNNETYQWWASNSSAGNYTPNNGWSTFYLSDPEIHFWGSWWDPTE